MASLRPQERVSLGRFTFSDGRRWRTPRSTYHPRFCFDHARKESQACAVDSLASDIAYSFSGERLSACDLSRPRPHPNLFRINSYRTLRKC